MAGSCPWKSKRDVSIRRCVVPIDGDKKAGRGCRFRGEKEEEDGKGGWRGSEKEARHPFAGKMAEEKLASFSFIFERTPPHRPVWTLAGLSVVATHRRGYMIVVGVLLVSRPLFFFLFFPPPCNIDVGCGRIFDRFDSFDSFIRGMEFLSRLD